MLQTDQQFPSVSGQNKDLKINSDGVSFSAGFAHGVGVALDLLGVRSAGRNEEILSALRSLEASTRAVNDAMQALPAIILERMREPQRQ